MLRPGDIVELDLGSPHGSEAGLRRPAVIVTARQILRGGPNVVHAVPLTRTVRDSGAEITLEPDDINHLDGRSAAQCQHIRAVATSRISRRQGNVGPVALRQIRETLKTILDT